MNDEEKFRKKLLAMLDENQYAYDADNWEKASQVLDQEDTGRRRRFLYILLFMGLGLVVGGYLVFVPGEAATEKLAVKPAAHTNTVEHNKALKPAEKTNAALPRTQASEKMPAAKPAQTAAEPLSIGAAQPLTGNHQAPSTKTTQPPVNTEPKETSNDRTHTKTRGKAALTVRPVIHSTPGKEDTGTQAPVVSKATGKEAKDNGPDNTPPVAEEKKAPVAAKEDEEAPATDPVAWKKKTEDTSSSDSMSSKQAVEPLPVLEPVPGKNKPEDAPATDHASITNQQAEKPPVAATPAETKKDSVQPPLAGNDSLVTKTPESTGFAAIQPTLQAQPAMNYCFAEAGGFLNLGWNYNGTREGMGVNPYLGLSYMMELGDKTSVSAGLYYTTVSGLALGSKTITSSRIVFGEEKDVIVITPQRMNFVAVPLKFYYSPAPKQSFSFGCSVNYLLDVQSKVTTHTEQLNTVRDEKTYRTGGYVEGFRTFNTQIGVGYRRTLYKQLSLNADLLFGLGDLRDDVFSGIPLKERMSGLRLSLTYDLIKK